MEHLQTPLSDPRLLPLRKRLIPLEEGPHALPPGAGDRIQAAVSLVLRAGEELEVLLIRRAEAEGDPWSGDMALPGGRQDPSDPDLLRTAVRETLEETGVCLRKGGRALGRLDPLAPVTRLTPSISILPFVFVVPHGTNAKPASSEVVQVFWVPLSLLWSPQASGTVEISTAQGRETFPCFRIEGNVVWGLTYRILRELERLF